MRQPDMPTGALDAQSVSAVIARLQPANCIVMEEALTVGAPYFDASKHAPRFTHLMLTGGAIGEGPGAATGAAIACPEPQGDQLPVRRMRGLFRTGVMDSGAREFGCRDNHRLQPKL